MLKVSVILPIYNVEKYIVKCVNSILSQSYENLELILVDDGSTDNSGKICDDFEKKDNRVKVIHKSNAGSGEARNTGLDNSTGDYILFVDPDDYIEKDLIRDNIELAEKYEADFVSFGYLGEILDKQNEYCKVTEFIPVLSGCYTRKELYENFRDFWHEAFQIWIRLYRKSYLERIGSRFMNTSVAQDALFSMNVYANDFNCVVFNQKTYYHYLMCREGSAVNKYHKGRFEIQLKLSAAIEKLADVAGYTKTEEGKMFVAKYYVYSLTIGMNNICLKGAPRSFFKKVKLLKEWTSIDKIKTSLKRIDTSIYDRKLLKIKILLLKHGFLYTAMLLQDIYVIWVKLFKN